MASRCLSSEDGLMMKKKIASLYRDLETFLKSDDFTDELKNELQQSNPDYLNVLEKRIKDIEKVDHGIVIAGETSAGKSTLINKILEKRIFKGRNNESTSTICKIRNSAKTRILTESMTGQIVETDLTEKDDVERALRDSLKKLTDMTSSKECIHFRSVDIGFPIPFLKDNTIIVDTPGIGGSGLVTEKLMEYLPNALSFIFVINVGSAGGMQKDRLPEILKSIVLLQMRNEMPCFECDNVIFITNKWDTIFSEYDSSEEDEETKTWKKLQSEIKERWPLVKEENIFKLNLKDVHISHEHQNCSTKEFKRFRQVLELNIKKAENIRVERHLRFLQDILKNIRKGLDARLKLVDKTEKEQLDLSTEHKKKITELTDECQKVKTSLLERLSKEIQEIAKKCSDEMSTEEGKRNILNPEGTTSIMKAVKCDEYEVSKIVQERVCQYLKRYLESPEIVKKFTELEGEATSFFEKTSLEIASMEKGWTEPNTTETIQVNDSTDDMSTASIVGIAIATSPIWLIVLAPIIGLGAVVVGILAAISPFALPVWLYKHRDAKKRLLIDEYYKHYQSSIEKLINDELESNHGMLIKTKIAKVTEEWLPNRINFLEKMITQLLNTREEILGNRDLISNLVIKLEVINNSAKSLEKMFQES